MNVNQKQTQRKITKFNLCSEGICSVILHLIIQPVYLNTVRLTGKNIKHCLFILYLCSIYLSMFVICLFSMLIYSPTKSPQSLIIFPIELFKSSGALFIYFIFHIAIYIAEITKYRNVIFFSNIVQP